MSKFLKILYAVQIIVIGLIISGIIPRVASIYWAVALSLVFILSPLEQASLFFIASIPLFVALPLTQTFDSFNMWRILSIILFSKWLTQKEVLHSIMQQFKLFVEKPWHYLKSHPLLTSTLSLLLLAIISLAVANDKIAGIKRIIYFINLSLVGIVIHDLLKKTAILYSRVITSICISTILVTSVGFAQLISTYFIDIYQFMRFWGETVELNLFGAQWSYIAVWKGNTWFAYFGDQLSLRMFSLFPDSHSFPVFMLMGLCALCVAYLLSKKHILYSCLILLVLLALILTGTRGIWASSVGVVLWIFAMKYLMHKKLVSASKLHIFKRLSYLLLLFFMLFAVAYPILASRQFRTPKDSDVMARRIRSILDFGETSNGQRIEIWKASIRSIINHPLLGVGIYNFPVVLNQKVLLGKAGSSAHNIYLHIAAEMGIPALIIALYIFFLIFRKSYSNFTTSNDSQITIYNGATLIFMPWVLLYLLTDFALFDERAFLMFVVTLASIFSTQNEIKTRALIS